MTEFKNSVRFTAVLPDVHDETILNTIKTCTSHTNLPLHSIQIRAYYSDLGFRSLTPFVNVVTDASNLEFAVNRVTSFCTLKMFEYQVLDLNKFLVVLYFKHQIGTGHLNIQKHQTKFINPFKVTLPTITKPYERADFLPASFNFNKWTDISTTTLMGNTYIYFIFNSKTFYVLSTVLNYNVNQYKVFVMDGANLKELITITDKFINDTSFIRTIGDKLSYTYDNSAIIRVDKQLQFPVLSTVKQVKAATPRFVTMDLECRLSQPDFNGVQNFTPYAVGICTHNSASSFVVNTFWLPDFASISDMLEAAFNSISSHKYNGLPVYFHNLNGFDLPFIVNLLTKLGKLKVIRRGSTILELKFYPNCSQGTYISIRDSFLLLPGSLDNLSKTFNVDKPKTAFPHQFVNIHDLNYVGNRPDESFWPIGNTQCGPETNWNLKVQLLEYLESDVISLAQVIAKFQSEIHAKYGINILRCLTLPSLAFKIFRSNYYDLDNTPIATIQGKVDDAIRQSYFGGVVDAFIPYGENLFKYDINSSYPASMKLDMPVGNPIFVDGINIDLQDFSIFGFYYCEVSTPQNVPSNWNPLLPVKSNGKTITPLGSWKGWYFTEELRYAVEHGYNVKLIHGYNFERGKPFDAYIDNWYDIKCTAPKGSVLYFMSKLFLNSLYGRFGMNTQLAITEIISIDQLESLMDNTVIQNVTYLDDNQVMIDCITPGIDLDDDIGNSKANKNYRQPRTNVAIASAITAYSRINVNRYKNITGNPCFYMDTDSVILQNPLPEDMVNSTTLGMMKLEHTIKRGIFLGPKSYCAEYYTPNNVVAYECKIKGLAAVKPTQNLPKGVNKPSFDQMLSLLYKDATIKLDHQIWQRDLESGTILVKNQPYQLRMTFSKRSPLYDNGKVIKTMPYIYRCNNNEKGNG